MMGSMAASQAAKAFDFIKGLQPTEVTAAS